MGDDNDSGSVTDCLLRFPILKDTLSSAELHYGKNQNKPNPNRCHRPLITQLRQVVCKMSTIVNLGGLGGQNWEKEYVYIVVD